MNPRDFLDSADDLLEGMREADWRTAISRAYYAAFLVAIELFRNARFAVPMDQAAHKYAYLRLNNCNHLDLAVVAQTLQDLRNARNRADYEMARSVDLREAIWRVDQSREVIRTLDDLADSDAVLVRVVEAMRAYERDVLQDVTFRSSP